MAFTEVDYKVADRIATITLNRPDQLNAWTGTMGKEVRQAMEQADADDSVRVIVLTGVFVVKTKSGDVRVAATGANQSGVMRVGAIENALKANFSASALDSIKIPDAGLLSDMHGSAPYRANLIKVMAQRAVQAAG